MSQMRKKLTGKPLRPRQDSMKIAKKCPFGIIYGDIGEVVQNRFPLHFRDLALDQQPEGPMD